MRIKKCNTLFLYLCWANFIISLTQAVSPRYLDKLLKKGAYKKFSKILEIPNVDLVDSSERKIDSYQQFFYNSLQLGDILLRRGQLLNRNELKKFNGTLKLSFKKWTNGTVPYYLSNFTFNNDDKNFIKKEIQQNNNLLGPNVVFRPYQEQDVDYVFLFGGGCGWYSNLGAVGGPQVISMPPPFVSGFLSHQFQHVLGFGHQHNRIDRDQYLKLRPENIPEDLKTQYIKYTSDNLVNWDPYDYYSILSYPVDVKGFGVTAMEILQDGVDESEVGSNFTLKPSDIQRVKRVYALS